MDNLKNISSVLQLVCGRDSGLEIKAVKLICQKAKFINIASDNMILEQGRYIVKTQ